ncbi:SDR family oxidoreductase [Desulfohalobiaceae bacterium Ax17]|uniref:SDR family oxidoreductase n=1 Tax=Desulfovulcanus ferrireducens TaxID=2831190 RepID=UPI00207BAB10|nr:SDR family oxidoreductase [Desulfovulcanus ferrireducens]MBT8763855.1 SDR family oxidoreductase [Desulfovulcanus ferrireducens]
MNIIIAGATGDIGTSISNLLSKNHSLLLLYKDENKREDLARKLEGRDVSFLSIQELFANEKMVLQAFSSFTPHVFINAIGDGFYAKVEDATLDLINSSYEANFKVPFYLTQLAYKVFLKQKHGYIVFVNSVSGLEGFPYGVAYCPFKFALRGLAEVMYKEGKRYGIKVSSIYPGIVKTKLLNKMPFIPKKGVLYPDEVARAVDYLLCLPLEAEVKELVLKNSSLTWRNIR